MKKLIFLTPAKQHADYAVKFILRGISREQWHGANFITRERDVNVLQGLRPPECKVLQIVSKRPFVTLRRNRFAFSDYEMACEATRQMCLIRGITLERVWIP